MNEIAPINLPAEFQEIEYDEFHPSNDEHNRRQENVRQAIYAHQKMMAPKHVQVARQYFAGVKGVTIAENLNISPNTVSKMLHRDDTQKLLGMLNYYQAAKDGMSIEHRRAILNRIAVRNEEEQPKVAMLAISEMNKMDVNAHNAEIGKGGPTQVSIIINQSHMPKTVLDG